MMSASHYSLHKGDLPDGLDLGPVIAIDSETMGLNSHRDRLCVVQLSPGDGTVETVKITELYLTDALERVDADEAGPGEIAAIAGLADVTIGETLADPDDPRPLPVIHIDDPSLAMTIGINTSPLAGQEGDKLTARLVKSRLDAELVGNVSLRVLPTARPGGPSVGVLRSAASPVAGSRHASVVEPPPSRLIACHTR